MSLIPDVNKETDPVKKSAFIAAKNKYQAKVAEFEAAIVSKKAII